MTLSLDDTLLAEARKRAAARNLSLQRYVEDALERAIAEDVVHLRHFSPLPSDTQRGPRSARVSPSST